MKQNTILILMEKLAIQIFFLISGIFKPRQIDSYPYTLSYKQVMFYVYIHE